MEGGTTPSTALRAYKFFGVHPDQKDMTKLQQFSGFKKEWESCTLDDQNEMLAGMEQKAA